MAHEQSPSERIDDILEEVVRRRTNSDAPLKSFLYIVYIIAVGLAIAAQFRDRAQTSKEFSLRMSAGLVSLLLLGLYVVIIDALRRSQEVHLIRVFTEPLQNSKPITVPTNLVLYPYHICGSISEFCAMRGSTYYSLLLVTTTAISWLLLDIGIQNIELPETIEDDPYCVASSIIFTCGCAGLFTIGVWELHPEDYCHLIMHHTGAVGLLCYGVAYGLKTEWSILSVSLFAAGLLFYFLWLGLKICVPKEYQSKKRVKMISILFIVLEMVYIGFFFLCGILFILELIPEGELPYGTNPATQS